MSQRFGCCFDADFVGLLNQCLHNDCIGKYIQGMPVKTPPASFYSAESLRPEGTIGLLMKRVMQSVLLQIDRRLAAHDLTHAQWLPLYRIARGGSFARHGDLARCQRRHGWYPSAWYAMGFRLAESR